MILIAHRGNTNGPQPKLENNPSYINDALERGYDCEIDVWCEQGEVILGHDEPIYKTSLEFLKQSGLWCHAKNIEALGLLIESNIHCFWHQDDIATLTSQGYIWTHSTKSYDKYLLPHHSIAVMPEWSNTNFIEHCAGICSDYVEDYK